MGLEKGLDEQNFRIPVSQPYATRPIGTPSYQSHCFHISTPLKVRMAILDMTRQYDMQLMGLGRIQIVLGLEKSGLD